MIESGNIHWLIQESCAEDHTLSSYALRVSSDFFYKLSQVSLTLETVFASSETHFLTSLWGNHGEPLISQFLDAVMMHMDSSSDATRLAALSAITTFASSSLNSLYFVAGLKDSALEGTDTVLSTLSDSHRGIGSKVLNCWAEMLFLKLDIQASVISSVASVMITTESLCRTEEDFGRHAQSILVILRKMGDVKKMAAMNYICWLAKQPLPIGKFAAFDLLRGFACMKKSWGLDIIIAHTETAEFLMVSTLYKNLEYELIFSFVYTESRD